MFKLGEWDCFCPVCGLIYKASEMKQRWDGIFVCGPDWEPRHPQDFVRSRPDQRRLPFTSPEPTDVFVSVTYNAATLGCPANSEYAQADFAAADCAIVGNVNSNLI